jgi:hypothetical protein
MEKALPGGEEALVIATRLLAQAEELRSCGYGIGHGILTIENNWCGEDFGPDWFGDKIRSGL